MTRRGLFSFLPGVAAVPVAALASSKPREIKVFAPAVSVCGGCGLSFAVYHHPDLDKALVRCPNERCDQFDIAIEITATQLATRLATSKQVASMEDQMQQDWRNQPFRPHKIGDPIKVKTAPRYVKSA